MFRRGPIVWSPVEIDYLKSNKDKPIDQLTIALAKSRNAIKNKLAELSGKQKKSSKKNSPHSKIGKRKDLGIFMRSNWESNILRYWIYKGLKAEYEPYTFTFTSFGIKHGTVAFTPDFKLHTGSDYLWVEVKGFLKASDKTRTRRLKKFFPEEFARLVVIVGSESTTAAKFFKSVGVPIYACYNDLNKQYKDIIPDWE